MRTVADRLQEVSIVTGSTRAFLLENEPHAYAAAAANFLAASLSFDDVPLLPPSPILSFSLCYLSLVSKLKKCYSLEATNEEEERKDR